MGWTECAWGTALMPTAMAATTTVNEVRMLMVWVELELELLIN